MANRLLNRVRDFAQVRADNRITHEVAKAALRLFEIDDDGLDQMDRRILFTIYKVFGGGPVGVDSLSAIVGEEAATIEDVYEPFLLQLGLVQRTARGRCLTNLGYAYLGLEPPEAEGEEN